MVIVRIKVTNTRVDKQFWDRCYNLNFFFFKLTHVKSRLSGVSNSLVIRSVSNHCRVNYFKKSKKSSNVYPLWCLSSFSNVRRMKTKLLQSPASFGAKCVLMLYFGMKEQDLLNTFIGDSNVTIKHRRLRLSCTQNPLFSWGRSLGPGH